MNLRVKLIAAVCSFLSFQAFATAEWTPRGKIYTISTQVLRDGVTYSEIKHTEGVGVYTCDTNSGVATGMAARFFVKVDDPENNDGKPFIHSELITAYYAKNDIQLMVSNVTTLADGGAGTVTCQQLPGWAKNAAMIIGTWAR